VVANHPLGGVDGILIMSMLRSLRSDVRMMANHLVGSIPEVQDSAILANPFEGESARRANIRAIRESMAWLGEGHMLVVFPAGEVSHVTWRKPVVTDSEWSGSVGSIIRKSEVPVLPVYFQGGNSAVFQIMGLIHPLLRTVMLPREALKKADRTFGIRVGKLISYRKVKDMSPEDMMSFLRVKTYVLAQRAESADMPERAKTQETGPQEEIVPAVDADILEDEIAALPAENLIVESGQMAVYLAHAESIPNVLREIGRLREVTFREVGEGTGKSIDLDRFDEYYLHLFVWHRENRELIGSYRLGETDRIRAEQGRDGLYVSTLFELNKKLLEEIDPALELGRSFVRLEYQRHHAPLMMLWKGIGRHIVDNPRYKRLFGPVSISNDYNYLSRQLMVMFLEQSRYLRELGKLVKPRTPLKRKLRLGVDRKAFRQLAEDGDPDDLSSIISDIEADEKGIPILLKHYLRMQARVLGFNVDEEFGDVVDGLMLVDLTETDPGMLVRYLGREGAQQFLAYHGIDMEAASSRSSEAVGTT
jgi:putative hemolysin